jgi:DNA-binding transcriptional LysR family regulator
MRSRYPGLELVVVTGNSAEIVAAVAANHLDLGIVTLPVSSRSLTVSPLCVDPLVAIAAPGRGLKRAPITAVDLARLPLILYERGGTIRRVIDEWFRRGRSTPPHHDGARATGEAIKKLVEAGPGRLDHVGNVRQGQAPGGRARRNHARAAVVAPTRGRQSVATSRTARPCACSSSGLQKLRAPSRSSER